MQHSTHNTLDRLRKKCYLRLDSYDWQILSNRGIVNGCGGFGSDIKNRLIRFIIRRILRSLRVVFIEASCNVHDFTYWQGGDEARRKECDLGFFKAIIADIDQTQKTVFSVLWYTILALVFYYSVRIGGRSYFNYRT